MERVYKIEEGTLQTVEDKEQLMQYIDSESEKEPEEDEETFPADVAKMI